MGAGKPGGFPPFISSGKARPLVPLPEAAFPVPEELPLVGQGTVLDQPLQVTQKYLTIHARVSSWGVLDTSMSAAEEKRWGNGRAEVAERRVVARVRSMAVGRMFDDGRGARRLSEWAQRMVPRPLLIACEDVSVRVGGRWRKGVI